MTRHLATCKARAAAEPAAASTEQRFHLVVGGRYAPMYWLHLDAAAEATLEDLDGYLRQCWLE
jgi:hypothetical protein